jgi:crotonobetainyl-CoA:carnitine CoA-transferase CaiB-like acyl-CoA transferase
MDEEEYPGMNEGTLKAPLAGVRVLDLTTMLSGPFGSQMLGDLGAEVIKIEAPSGDNTRTFPPHYHHGESIYYLSINRNKKSVVVDLKRPEGLEVFYDLVKKADVVWENFRGGVSKRLKIDHDRLKEINPGIITCSITSFGTGNPHDGDQPTYDLCMQAMSGVLDMTGEPGRPPVKMGVPMADLSGGWYAVVGLLAALLEKSRTGVGQHVDVAMLDGLVSLHTYEAAYCLYSGIVPQRIGTSHRSVVPYQIFPTKSIYIAIVATLDKFWIGLCQALGIPECAKDERYATLNARYENREAAVKLLSDVLATRDCEEWIPLLRKAGVPSAPVNTLDKALSEPALLHRNMVIELDHFGDPVKVIGNPIKLSNMQEHYASPPGLGEHSEAVLRDWLAYSDERIAELKGKGIIATYKEKEVP